MEILDPQSTPESANSASTASAPQPQEVKPDNFLAWAIISTILCCLPFGIVAIVYASQVDSYWFAGNHEAARRSARNARTWTWVSVGVAAFCWVAYLLLVFVFAAAVSLPFFDL
ncbi:CD225/dispanin family protein [uncultured Alistipes sp.]|uniref:CD225/dispanin family protein n=1 Tax=uncultured Alistipes sp. TaxID=538949 RepID=UPI003209F616